MNKINFFEVYWFHLEIMKQQKDKGMPSNEGIAYEEVNCDGEL